MFGFTPSNVDLSQLDFSGVTDIEFTTSSTWETNLGGVFGGTGTYHYKELTQRNGLKLGVFTAKSVKVDPNVVIHVEGADALVIVALDTIVIDGTVEANTQSNPFFLGAGALSPPSQSNVDGVGPGGGPSGDGNSGGPGGGFCGTGGPGGTVSDTGAAQGGGSYGTPNLIPLYAGSSGGASFATPGAGGGAIQLIAANSISVGGVLHVSGEGGGPGGIYNASDSQNASGGGSGGAILLESLTVTVTGTLAANGGAGGQGDQGAHGADAAPAADAAKGGNDPMHGSPGGDGSDDLDIKGKAGAGTPKKSAGGGGGGAGRIRINTSSGMPSLSGKLTPSPSTPCATFGVVAP